MRPLADDAVSYGMGQARLKLRRVGKWVGLVIVLIVLGVDVTSVWCSVVWLRSTAEWKVKNGGISVRWFRNSGSRWASPGWYINDWQFDSPSHGLPSWYISSGFGDLEVPLWTLATLAALPSALLWWYDRRGKAPGLCAACNYDLTGLAPGSTCPECGKTGAFAVPAPEKS